MFLWLYSTFQTDNGALLFGKLFGSYRLFPYISPQKTIQGVLGGYFLCFVSLLLLMPLGEYSMVPNLSIYNVIVLSIVVSTLAITGDLTESFIKRVGEVKDSGALFPGHGGMLDRADSLVFIAPVVYYYSKYYLV
jgi:phosphatidate cytidylyltransferase